MYGPFISDCDDSPNVGSRSFFKVGVALSGVASLVLLAVVYNDSTADSAELIGLSASRFAATPGVIGRATLSSLPGPRPWKDLAIAGMEIANVCDRGASMKAKAGLQGLIAKMDHQSKAVVARASREVAVRANTAKEMPGIVAPLGFFDPLGFSTDVSQGKLLFYREVELKHGRVCMLAALGILVAEQFHPLFGGNIDVPAYIAFQETPLQQFWVAVALAIAIPEVASIATYQDLDGDKWAMKENRISGDLGFDPLGLRPADPAELLELQNKEILNGRLAMISAAGMIAQELVTKQKIF
jgi:hypothetical protein